MDKKDIIKRVVIVVFAGVIVSAILAYRFRIKYFFIGLFMPKTSKLKNDEKIKMMHPIFAIRVAKFVKYLEDMGMDVTINSGYRTFEHQAQVNPSVPVSYHNFGGAVDMNVDGMGLSTSKSKWQEVGNIGKEIFGFRWGGDFNNYDPIHFDFGNEYETDTLKNMLDNNEVVYNKYPKL